MASLQKVGVETDRGDTEEAGGPHSTPPPPKAASEPSSGEDSLGEDILVARGRIVSVSPTKSSFSSESTTMHRARLFYSFRAIVRESMIREFSLPWYEPHEQQRIVADYECEAAWYFGLQSFGEMIECLEEFQSTTMPLPDAVSLFGSSFGTASASRELVDFMATFEGAADASVACVIRQSVMAMYRQAADPKTLKPLLEAAVTLHLSTTFAKKAQPLLYLGLRMRRRGVFFGFSRTHTLIVAAEWVRRDLINIILHNVGDGIRFHDKVGGKIVPIYSMTCRWTDLQSLHFFMVDDIAKIYQHDSWRDAPDSVPKSQLISEVGARGSCIGGAFEAYLRANFDSCIFNQLRVRLLMHGVQSALLLKTHRRAGDLKMRIYAAVLTHAYKECCMYPGEVLSNAAIALSNQVPQSSVIFTILSEPPSGTFIFARPFPVSPLNTESKGLKAWIQHLFYHRKDEAKAIMILGTMRPGLFGDRFFRICSLFLNLSQSALVVITCKLPPDAVPCFVRYFRVPALFLMGHSEGSSAALMAINDLACRQYRSGLFFMAMSKHALTGVLAPLKDNPHLAVQQALQVSLDLVRDGKARHIYGHLMKKHVRSFISNSFSSVVANLNFERHSPATQLLLYFAPAEIREGLFWRQHELGYFHKNDGHIWFDLDTCMALRALFNGVRDAPLQHFVHQYCAAFIPQQASFSGLNLQAVLQPIKM